LTLFETNTKERTIDIGITAVDRSGFVAVSAGRHRSATCDPGLRRLKECHLTRTANVAPEGFGPFAEAVPHTKFTFVINHETFPTSAVDGKALSPAVRGQLRVDTSATTFTFSDREISSVGFRNVREFLSGMKIVFPN
jgi:hypothetical protein